MLWCFGTLWQDLAPVINVAVTLGVDSTHPGGGVEPRTGLSLSIGE